MASEPLPTDLSRWSAGDIDHAVKVREDEKHRLELELARLLTSRNGLRPVSRLPDEILAAIFLQCHTDAVSSEIPAPNTAPYGPPQPALGAVCRRWRTVYNSYPLLWCSIIAVSIERLNLQLQRSKQSPLHVAVVSSEWSTFFRIYAHLLVNAASRIRALDLHVPEHEIPVQEQALPSPSQCALRSLEVLRIDVRVDYAEDTGGLAALLQPLDGKIQPYNNLQNLNCTHIPWSFVQTVLRPSMTVLRVSSLSQLGGEEEWLSALKAMPQLTELLLCRAIGLTNLGEEPQALSSVVHLPHLTTLTLLALNAYDGLCYFNLWNHLRLPKLSHIHLGFDDTLPLSPERFYRWVVPKCSADDTNKPYITAWLTWPPARMVGLSLPHMLLGSSLGLSSANPSSPPLDISRPFYTPARTFSTSITQLHNSHLVIEHLPLSHVTTLVVNHVIDHDNLEGTFPDIWDVLAAKMTHVTFIDISHANAATGFLAKLRCAAKTAALNDRPFEFFRKLEHLKFSGAYWSNGVGVSGADVLGGWADIPACPCTAYPDELLGCSCMLDPTEACICEAGVVCDCECKWVKERFNKLIVEALRWRSECGMPHLRRLDIRAPISDDTPVPRGYSKRALNEFVGELNIQLCDAEWFESSHTAGIIEA